MNFSIATSVYHQSIIYILLFHFFEILHMGTQCLSRSLNETYHEYLAEVKVSELKDLWQAVKIYKMKKLFDSTASPSQQSKQNKHLTYQGFKKLFPELQTYSEKQKYRLYEFFDLEEKGFVDWNNFYSAVTILYFSSEKTLAVIMFMMFDHTLSLSIDSIYLKLMLESNEAFFKLDENDNSPEVNDLHKQLLTNNSLPIEKWLKKVNDIIDFSKFRKVFNIFMEEKMEKELVHNFYDWNEIYNEEKQKYIGYLVSLKWYQSWRLYIYHHYNINIDIYSLTKPTIRTVKTCKKTFNKMSSSVKIGIDSSRALHGCRMIQIQAAKQKSKNIKNIDCVHNHLGERPRQITNSQLQGQFQEVLRVGVSENMDYVIVSEKIWNHLKGIYDGYPEFRRSGFDAIQLYPKIIKAYFTLFKGHLDYSSQVIREVSAYLAVNQLLTKSCQIEQQKLANKIIYFKTIGMPKWEQIEDYSYLFTELSSQIMIFLVCINKEDREIFQKSHLKQAKDVTQVNLGDYLIHKSSSGEQKRVVFMGKSIQGKYILHISGQSYSSDICLIESELIKTCTFAGKFLDIGAQKKVIHSNLQGLPSGPGLGFINSVLQVFINNKDIVSQLIMMNQERNDKLIYNLVNIQSLVSKQARIQFGDIKNTVELFLSKYLDFQVSQSFNFLTDFYDCLTQEIKDESLPNFLNNFQMSIQKTVYCKHCKSQTTNVDDCKILSVPLSQDKTLMYDVLWIPANLKSNEITKYKIKVQKGASLDDFINSLEEEIGIKDKAYIITEVFGSDIIKNYHSAQRSAKLKILKMRETDQIYVYQLLTDLSSFVKNHFNTKWEIDDEEIKKQMLIDCKHPERGWIFGKVTQIEYLPYTQTSIVKVIHKFNKNQSWQVSYDVFQQTIGRFPLKSYDNADHYHIRMHQRVFNQASNSMLLVNMPLITLLPGWMRWKEFFYLVYQQIKHFIAPEYEFNQEEGKQKIGKSMKKINKKVDMVDLFKQYKTSTKFPYKMHLIDYEGRCAVCYKFLKLVVYKGENQLYCEGCQLSQLQPIAWQVKPADLLVCIDWYGTNRFKKAIIKEQQSIATLNSSKKNVQSLVSCIDNLREQNIVEDEALCCNIFSQKKVWQKIVKAPEILTIYLERVVEEEDGFKKVVKKIVKIPMSKLQVNGSNYRLFAATSIEGQHLNIRHKTYILKGGEQWYEYDGKLVRVVDSKYVESVCVLVLYYQKCRKV